MDEAMVVQADYCESPVPDYQGNPLIESLPPILSEDAAGAAIARFPDVPSDEERRLPAEERLHCIDRLRYVVQPLPIHLELESVVSVLLRSGYVGRNPMRAETWRHLYSLSTGYQPAPGFSSTASTFSLVGHSGIGKSTALESILQLYPQAIRHQRYRDHAFIHTQITWLKLDCPHDGSLSGLCRAFFRAVDKVIGQERYSHSGGLRGIPDMIQRMEQVASIYFIGGLFIDELQHLKAAKTGGKENMLNFFVSLLNQIGIPVAFIGTYSMLGLFADVMRNARRACGMGNYPFVAPVADDPFWKILLDALWSYQWIKQPGPLTPEISDTLYDLTQGITDFLVKLMILGQRHAIQTGQEELSVAGLHEVFDTRMQLLKPAIAALCSGDPERMAQFEDLLPTKEQMEAMMAWNISSSTLARRQALLARLAPVPQADSPSSAESSTPSVPVREGPIRHGESKAGAYVSAEDSVAAVRQAGWLLQDAFEFSSAYRTVA